MRTLSAALAVVLLPSLADAQSTTSTIQPIVSGVVTLTPLDVATVATGGTAVVALAANHRTKGGWIQNPSAASVNLCINEIGTASGTTSAGNTICIAPGVTYNLAASYNAVSVVTSDSAHAFAGYGFN